MLDIQRYGDRSIIVDFGDSISPKVNDQVLSIAGSLDWETAGIRTVIPTYNRLVIEFERQVDIKSIEQQIASASSSVATSKKHRWTIPVCYELGLDHDRIQQHTGLDLQSLIDYHCSQELYMYGYGFLPGMPKLGDTSIAAPGRLSTPRYHVPAGSIGWIEHHCNIYPRTTTAGWNVIGRTPAKLFDISQSQPNLISPGDRVRFYRITLQQFESGDYEIASVEI